MSSSKTTKAGAATRLAEERAQEDRELTTRISVFCADSERLQAEVKDNMKEGNNLLEEAIKADNLGLFVRVSKALYFDGPKASASQGHLQGVLKDVKI